MYRTSGRHASRRFIPVAGWLYDGFCPDADRFRAPRISCRSPLTGDAAMISCVVLDDAIASKRAPTGECVWSGVGYRGLPCE
ncbi:hypothetical protein [Pseudomonas sp. FEN]|nr:hypothetical protein [Pseudomonas sp. FEN]